MSAAPATGSQLVPLGGLVNNQGSTRESALTDGQLNVWRNSLPAGRIDTCDDCGLDLQIVLPGQGPDNVVALGQVIPFPRGHYRELHVIGAGERAVDETILLCDGHAPVSRLSLSMPDLWEGQPRREAHLAHRSLTVHYPHHVQVDLSLTLWHHQIALPNQPADRIVLPHNLALHIFAVRLGGAAA